MNIQNKIQMNMNMNMEMPLFPNFMQMNQMMNNIIQNMMGNNFGSDEYINLVFVLHSKITNFTISKQKTVQEAINLFRLKSGNNDKDLKFIFEGRTLNPELKIIETGLKDGSKIIVVKKEFISLFFLNNPSINK